MSEKKVVAVIVEGTSDENAIGGILKEFFSSEEVQFAVVMEILHLTMAQQKKMQCQK